MSIDPVIIGELAQQFMQQVEEDYGEDAEIIDAMVLAEVQSHREDTVGSQISYRCTSARPVVQRGLVGWLIGAVEHGEGRDEDVEE